MRLIAAASALAMVAVACGGGGKKGTQAGVTTTTASVGEAGTTTTSSVGEAGTTSTIAASSNVTTATTVRSGTATTARRTTATTATKSVTKGPAGNIINVTSPPTTAPNKAAQPGGTITWLTSAEQIGYDPVNVSGAGSADGRAAAMIFDLLVYYDANGVVQPQTADSLTSTDALVWTLKLKPNIKFSDGTPYDAAAVKFNYQRLQDPNNRASRAAQANLISAMDVLDAQSLRITLKAKNAVFPQAMVLIAVIGSPTAIQKQGAADFNNNPVGAGPYTMRSWVRDSQMIMVRNPNYWNAPLPYVDSYILRPITDETQRLNSYCAGQGNMVFITVLQNADQIKRQNCGTMIPSVLNGGIVLYFNTTKAPMNDARLRKAVAMAIDVNDYSKVVDGGLIPPLKSVFDTSSPFYDQGILQQPFNSAQAQAIFDQVAAESGGTVNIPMSTFALVNYQTTAQYIQAILQKYNHVKVDLVNEAAPAHVTSCTTRAYAGICVFAGFFTDPEPGWTGTFICASPASPTGYCSSTFDAAVADNQLTLDPAKRIADIKDAQRQFYADVPAYYLEQRMTWTFTAPNIQDFQYVNDGLPLIDRLWIKSHAVTDAAPPPAARFSGKVAIVTGGAGGIGRATAHRFASEGATVVINDVDDDRIADAVASLGGLSGRGVPGRADVTSESEVQHLVDRVVAEHGGVDILINNAGGAVSGHQWATVEDSTLDDWNSFIALNLTGPFICARAVLPSMLAKGRGHIVSVSSVSGLYGQRSGGGYAAAKAGLTGLTATLAKEVGPRGVNVNAIVVGNAPFPNRPAEHQERLNGFVHLGRGGRHAEFAAAIAFLCSEDASYLSGAMVPVDGGWTRFNMI